MDIYFFDTCALVCRYAADQFTNRVNRIVQGKNRTIHISDLTVVEISSALAKTCRARKLSASEFFKMRAAFEDDIANGLIQVETSSQADLLSARDLLEDAAVLNHRDLRSSDAIIVSTSRGLAYTLDRRITFYTRDWKLYSSVRGIGSYTAALRLRYLGKGKGGIPSSTG